MKRIIIFATLLAGGCVSPWLGSGTETMRAQPTPVEPTPMRVADSEPVTTMAAVEAFLDRTRDYQLTLHADPLVPPAVPAVESMNVRALQGHPAAASTNAHTSPPPIATNPEPRSVANAQVSLDSMPARPRPAAPVLTRLSVRTPPVSISEPPEPTPPSTRTTNQPLDSVEGDVVDQADRFVDEIARRAKGSGRIADALRLRVLRELLDRPVSVAEDDASATMPIEVRQLASQWVDVYRALADVAESPLQPCDEAIERLDRMKELLVERADPTVSAIALCRKVATFGVYDPMPLEELVAGRTIQTIVYCELNNLRSEPTSDGQHRTSLSTRLELFDSGGQSVWSQEESNIEDRCRRKRSDFFIAQRVTFPANLPAGEYVLKVTVTDELSNRINEGGLPFALKQPGTVAQGR